LGRREEQQQRLLTERECAIAIRCATASVASKTYWMPGCTAETQLGLDHLDLARQFDSARGEAG
jgi:hypothetical protein